MKLYISLWTAAKLLLLTVAVLSFTTIILLERPSKVSQAANAPSPSSDVDHALFLLGRVYDPFITLHAGRTYDAPANLVQVTKADELWASLPTNGSSHEILDLSSGFEDSVALEGVLEHLIDAQEKVDVLVLGGPYVETTLIDKATEISTLRVIVLDSTAISKETTERLKLKWPGVEFYTSQRLWIHALQRSNLGLRSIIISKQKDRQWPWFLDDDHLLRVKSIGMARQFYFFHGDPIEKEACDIIPLLDSLEHLDLGGADVDDQYLKRLSTLTGLKALRLSDTAVTGESFDCLPTNNLTAFDIAGISCKVCLPEMSGLELLVASNTRFSVHPFLTAQRFPKLSYLDVSGADITLEDVTEISKLRSLSHIVLDSKWREHVNLVDLEKRGIVVEFVSR